MAEKPEALRLVEWIDSDFDPDEMLESGYDRIAAELRRLHGENERLEKERDRLRVLLAEAEIYVRAYKCQVQAPGWIAGASRLAGEIAVTVSKPADT
ncbi:hypothetical protein [Methylomagnum ishizawai]|uniref:hypothetical protein n=1 Tax=Methylomagnum ishizawai TaxID=1760988 RepID=UPI001C3224BC|nr:hypothetical protein [Methylomagnum ishizawai]BBL75602.1 hypothetical protein MishRS11D_27000 [Methylomagnum ishizawai]